jgi:hypothetical protein
MFIFVFVWFAHSLLHHVSHCVLGLDLVVTYVVDYFVLRLWPVSMRDGIRFADWRINFAACMLATTAALVRSWGRAVFSERGV